MNNIKIIKPKKFNWNYFVSSLFFIFLITIITLFDGKTLDGLWGIGYIIYFGLFTILFIIAVILVGYAIQIKKWGKWNIYPKLSLIFVYLSTIIVSIGCYISALWNELLWDRAGSYIITSAFGGWGMNKTPPEPSSREILYHYLSKCLIYSGYIIMIIALIIIIKFYINIRKQKSIQTTKLT